MKTLFLNDTPITVSQADLLGEGGEAEVFRLDRARALKLFKQPNHPQFNNASPESKILRQAAVVRLEECQLKLPAFPKGIAPHLVEPQQLAFNKPNQRIVGYTMPLITPAHSLREYSQKAFRDKSNIESDQILNLFKDLHETVSRIHAHNMVVGDFNQLNVLVSGTTTYLIDADSMQFGTFLCKTFTARYSDPLILMRHNNSLFMKEPHSRETDWYAFAVLLFECLLMVHPYGGIYKPDNPSDRLGPDERVIKRVSILHPKVQSPNCALAVSTLSDRLIEFFEDILTKDVRKIFPLELLEKNAAIRRHTHSVTVAPLQTCSVMNGTNTASPSSNLHRLRVVTPSGAPVCAITTGRTASKSRKVFTTDGVIIKVVHDGERLRYLYHDSGKFIRESGRVILHGVLDPDLRFAICGDDTLIGKNAKSFRTTDGSLSPFKAEQYRDQYPVFDANRKTFFYVEEGHLFADHANGPRLIDEVLTRQTSIFAGSDFGFGYYLAGQFRKAFLFEFDRPGKCVIDENVLDGQILKVATRFSQHVLWLLVTIERAGSIVNRCCLINRLGKALASHEEEEGLGNWIDFMHTACAASLPQPDGSLKEVLFVSTANGIVQVEASGFTLHESNQYPGTAQLVSDADRLVFSTEGLYACSSKAIRLITN